MYKENLQNWEDSALLLQITARNRAAFDVLYDRHFTNVYNAAYRRLKDLHQAADVAQEVFVQLWTRESKAPILNLQAYLSTLVRNCVFKLLEREKKYIPLPEVFEHWEEHSAAADTILLYQEFVRCFEQVVTSLSPQQQVIFKMRYEHDLNPAEIASRLNISPKTVRNQLGKALLRLKSAMALFSLLYFVAHNR